VRECGPDDVDRTGERDGDGAVEVVGMDLQHMAQDRHPRVGDDDVEAAEGRDGFGHRRVDALTVGDVGGDRDRVEPVLGDDLPERVLGPADEREPRAFGREAPGRFEPYARAGAGDQDAASDQSTCVAAVGLLGRMPAEGSDVLEPHAGALPGEGVDHGTESRRPRRGAHRRVEPASGVSRSACARRKGVRGAFELTVAG
jgi:hypothetical protein